MDFSLVVMWVGFILAAYSVVGNDVIQTLGTFLTSNEDRLPWWGLWLFAATILSVALINGYLVNDIDYGRLDKFPVPSVYQWYYLLPPLVLMMITRFGIPVSTTFMILTLFSLQEIPNDIDAMVGSVFDNKAKLGGMIQKSLIGYVVAFLSSVLIYLGVTRFSERYFINNPILKGQILSFPAAIGIGSIMGMIFYAIILNQAADLYRIGGTIAVIVATIFLALKVEKGKFWTGFQWFTTGFLWFQWLTQDLANIYIYLGGGTDMTFAEFGASMAILLGLLAYIFYQKGGAVQQVVREKTNTADIRSATFIDLIYGVVLYIFKYNYLGLFEAKLPMSTTWVFIGLLAGRELGVRFHLDGKITNNVAKMLFSDLGKVFFGLLVSVLLVFAIKLLAV